MADVSEETTDAGEDILKSLGIDLSAPEAVEDEEDEILPQVKLPSVVLASPPHFEVPRTVLRRMVDQAMLVVPSGDFVPELKNLVLDASDGRLVITGSNSGSTVVSTSLAVRTLNPGRLLIGAAKFANVIKRASGPTVKLRTEDQLLHIDSGSSSWSLRIAGVQEYVRLAALDELTWHSLSRADFTRAVSAVRYAAGSDENDPGRMQLDIHNGIATTTDKTSFAQVRGMLPANLTCELSTSAVDLLVKMLDRNDAQEFRLADTRFHLVAEIGPVDAADRMIVAHNTESFPAEARTIIETPIAENRDEVIVNADTLVEALDRAQPTSDEETLAVALKVGYPEPDELTVATRNRYGDLSSEQLTVTFRRLGSDSAPSPRTVLLNQKRLTEAVRASALARSASNGSDEGVNVRLLLGTDRSRSRPAFVVVQDSLPEGEEAAGSVRAVLLQVRSDWIS
ncbi:MAG: hypothetical protein WC054_00375 [Candidatus Nanopelagicales bacterium]